MAGKKPFFITGATAKIKVNGIVLAYCTGVSYSVQVNHAAPRILGMYEPTSIEPTSYLVTGSFSVVRYTAEARDYVPGAPGSSSRGNGIGAWRDSGSSVGARLIEAKAEQSLNPGRLQTAAGFDIEIWQKLEGENLPVAKIKGARITKADFSLNKQSPASQSFQFTALYADEDSFLTAASGSGQQFE